MSATLLRFRRDYRAALVDHLPDPGEPGLHAAYELGRRAVLQEVTVIDLAAVHHDALAEVLDLPVPVGGEQARELLALAGAFLAESLSAYEMVRRGYREAREAAELERHHAQTIRRLSSFLADASLASDADGSLQEVLQLIAEEARELVDAEGCMVAVHADGSPPWLNASSPAELAAGLGAAAAAHHLAVHVRLQAHGGPVHLDAEELRRTPHIAALGGDEAAPGWLGTPLVALDGRLLGWIEVFGWERGGPTELDEALIVHLGQMASAALERARLYGR
jgi:GAF domain-containing protein